MLDIAVVASGEELLARGAEIRVSGGIVNELVFRKGPEGPSPAWFREGTTTRIFWSWTFF